MAKQTINNLESGATVRNKINSNFTELYEQKADKNHSFTDSSYGAASNELYGHVKINVANGLNVNDGLLSLAYATTSTAGAVQLASSIESASNPNSVPTISQLQDVNNKLESLENNTPPKNHAVANSDYGLATNSLYGHVKVTPGNGLALTDGTISLNTATVNIAGAVQLEDTLASQSDTRALTARAGYELDQRKAEVFYGYTEPTGAIGRDGDIYFLLEKD